MRAAQDSQRIPHDSHTDRQWQNKFFGMGAKCYYCEIPLKLKEAEREHRTPKCRGGSDCIHNIVPACKRCNRVKGWRTEEEFAKARPALFCKNAQAPRGNTKPNPQSGPESLNFSMIDAPPFSLLRKESESTSWAWRNPATERRRA